MRYGGSASMSKDYQVARNSAHDFSRARALVCAICGISTQLSFIF